MATPITSALRIVPSPGRWRSGIHSSSSAKLMAIVAVPMLSGVCLEMPCANTLQGELPRSEATRHASPAPKTHRPNSREVSLRGEARQREATAAVVVKGPRGYPRMYANQEEVHGRRGESRVRGRDHRGPPQPDVPREARQRARGAGASRRQDAPL